MRGKLCILAALFVVLSLILIVQVKAADFSWKDDFNYTDVSAMQNAGWTFTNPGGVSLRSEGVVVDGTKADTVIRYDNHFPGGILEWSVETRSMWLGTGHSGPGIDVMTREHTYYLQADGWYNHFAFGIDGKRETFGSYSEQANVWVTLAMVKKNNAISIYYNGDLIKTYNEEDTSPSELVGVERITPWRGVMLYDYFVVGPPNSTSATGSESSGFPLLYVAVGGGIAAIVVGGAAAYFFFIVGGTAAGAVSAAGASSVGAAGTAGSVLGSTTDVAGNLAGISSDLFSSAISNLVYENLFHDTVTNIMTDLGYDCSNLAAPADPFSSISTTELYNVMQHPEEEDAVWALFNKIDMPEAPNAQTSPDQVQNAYENITGSITDLTNIDLSNVQPPPGFNPPPLDQSGSSITTPLGPP